MSSDSTTPGRRRSIVLVLLLLLVAAPAVLLAHAQLQRSTPASGQRLAASPAAITLWFSERPQIAFTRIALTAAGASIPLGPPTAVADYGVTARIVEPLPAGAYVVAWRTAATDGHRSSGRYGFTIVATKAAVKMPGSSETLPAGNTLVQLDQMPGGEATSNGQAVTRWAEFIALLTVVGTVVFRLVLLPGVASRGVPLADAAESARRLAQAALVLVFVALLSRLYTESLLMNGAGDVLDRDALQTLLLSTWGNGWLVGAAGAVTLVVGTFVAGRHATAGWLLSAIGAAALVVSPALTGHAAADPAHPATAIVVDAGHVLGASAWLGTLLVLVLIGIPCILRRPEGARGAAVVALVNAFNPIALAGAALVVATGVASAWLRLTTFGDLWQTTYGRTLLVKLCVFIGIVLFGAYNWRRLTPTLGDDESPRRLRRSAAGELLLAVALLAVTGVLVGTATPQANAPITPRTESSPP